MGTVASIQHCGTTRVKWSPRPPVTHAPVSVMLVVAIAFTVGTVVYSEDAEAANYSISAVMTANQIEIASSSGLGFHAAELIMQSDGNLVLYKTTYTQVGASRTAVWSTLTHGNPGARAQFQSDGNLVVYGPQPGNAVLFQTQTNGNFGISYVLSGDASLGIYGWDSAAIWESSPDTQATSGSGSQAPWRARFADNKSHSHITVDNNPAQVADWQWRIDGPGAEGVYEPTDLTIFKSSGFNNQVDVIWEQVPDTPGLAIAPCIRPINSQKCDQFHVQFGDDLAALPSHIKTNAVCHEWGHTIGAYDGGANGASCWTGGDNNKLRSWEISKINSKY